MGRLITVSDRLIIFFSLPICYYIKSKKYHEFKEIKTRAVGAQEDILNKDNGAGGSGCKNVKKAAGKVPGKEAFGAAVLTIFL